jgi:glycosyltransferase involved in cell wall biosynthesis
MMAAIAITMIFASFACAVVPAALFLVNLRLYRPPEGCPVDTLLAVLIPARDEEANIGACIESVLASTGVDFEVLVLDDASTDRTGEIVRDLAEKDGRIRLVQTQTLPAGWNGKQRACWLLANETTAPLLLFLDADVRLSPNALRLCVAQLQVSKLALLSGFPRQITVGWLEKLVLPLIHFVLLSFLPMGWMRKSVMPAFAAGCGQFFLADREAYFACGGHNSIRETRHDGLRLPTLFRQHGFRTDIFDLTALAEVRMYDSPRAVWMGLAKNATEGIATPTRMFPFTVLLVLGQIAPTFFFVMSLVICTMNLIVGATFDQPALACVVGLAITLAFVASYLPRILAARRFRQPMISAALHPLGVSVLLGVQWYAFQRQFFGRPVAWRDRSYSSDTGEEISQRLS